MSFWDTVAKWYKDANRPKQKPKNEGAGDSNPKPGSSGTDSTAASAVANGLAEGIANTVANAAGNVLDDVSKPVVSAASNAGNDSSNPVENIANSAKIAAKDVGNAMADSLFSAPANSQSSYFDATSPGYDPTNEFLNPRIAPIVQRQERAADQASYDQYMDYYNDENENPDKYDDSHFDADYLAGYLPGHGGEDLIDDGTNSYLNRTSHFITGAEARKQAMYFGNDDLLKAMRRVGNSEVLSKDSLKKFGYRPFTDTSSTPEYLGSKLSQGLSTVAEASEQAWNDVANLRNDKTDWTVELFDVEFHGKAVDKAIYAAQQKGAGAYDEDGNWMKSGIKLDPTKATQREDGLWVTPASDGKEYVIDAQKFDSGGYTLRYQDAIVMDKEGHAQHIPMEYWGDATKNYAVAEYLAAVYYPEMSEEEKEKKAAEMYKDMGSATYYGPLNVKAPSYKTDSVLSEYALPTLINGALSSAAYFNPYTLAERTALAENLSASGLNATTQSVSNNGIRSYFPAADNAFNTSMGVLAPVAESNLGSLGNFGGKGFLEKGAETISTKIPGIGSTWLGRELIPAAASEGMEEVITDPLYALQESATGAYADQATNDQGLLAYDEYGRPVYENTGMAKRMGNYIKDQPDNFIMGAAMGGGIHGGARLLQHVTPSGREQLKAEKADRDFFNQHVRQTGGAFTREEVEELMQQARIVNNVDDMMRQAGIIDNIADSPALSEKVPFTMQEFEEMLRNMNAVEEMADEDTLDAQVKRNVR